MTATVDDDSENLKSFAVSLTIKAACCEFDVKTM